MTLLSFHPCVNNPPQMLNLYKLWSNILGWGTRAGSSQCLSLSSPSLSLFLSLSTLFNGLLSPHCSAGSDCTPAHKYKDFTFKTYSPEAFRYSMCVFIHVWDTCTCICTCTCSCHRCKHPYSLKFLLFNGYKAWLEATKRPPPVKFWIRPKVFESCVFESLLLVQTFKNAAPF